MSTFLLIVWVCWLETKRLELVGELWKRWTSGALSCCEKPALWTLQEWWLYWLSGLVLVFNVDEQCYCQLALFVAFCPAAKCTFLTNILTLSTWWQFSEKHVKSFIFLGNSAVYILYVFNSFAPYVVVSVIFFSSRTPVRKLGWPLQQQPHQLNWVQHSSGSSDSGCCNVMWTFEHWVTFCVC